MPQAAIFSINTPKAFERLALQTFKYQYEHVSVYRNFSNALNKTPASVKKIAAIPFMPVAFFKTHSVLDASKTTEAIFTSSGTTGAVKSKHYVVDLGLYEMSFSKTFELFFGPVEDIVILALLPSYFNKERSSLIYMVDDLVRKSKNQHSGFFLNDTTRLIEKLNILEKEGRKTLLIGVSFALLDLIEEHSFRLNNTIIMETGGMKGRRKEMIREELHARLKKGFGVEKIYSEYGMTELLSQAYSSGDGIFKCPPWMKIFTRDTEDALSFVHGKTGGINVIDLANKHSCSFIATQDLGKLHSNGSFEILGRFDTSDVRGCNLMVL